MEHFYTTNAAEIGTTTAGQKGNSGYTSEGIAAYVFATQTASAQIPLYRYWNGKEHFYTTDANEIGTTTAGKIGKYSYTSEGIAAYVYP